MDETTRKLFGAYYTAESVVGSLVRWAVRSPTDRLLDPACGDGRFLAQHANSVGVEQDASSAIVAHQRSPGSLVHQGDFFSWAGVTKERFECAAGNPPFIRYQRFNGEMRKIALALCAQHGAEFSALSSSWAPFLVATATLLRRGGRMAFVVPAEIGHAPYAAPLLCYLAGHFASVQLVALREKLFPDLSEDCWLLYAEGFGSKTDHVLLSPIETFSRDIAPPYAAVKVSIDEWRRWNYRLRPFLLSSSVRSLYQAITTEAGTRRLGEIAKVGIGYVTGANDFFHLRPSDARRMGISRDFLHPAVRNGRVLSGDAVTEELVQEWTQQDNPIFLLRLSAETALSSPVKKYLGSTAASAAQATFKCRTRDPWYAVPDVTIPDAFLSYMSTDSPTMVANKARCVGTNSVHMVKLIGRFKVNRLLGMWNQPVTKLSCEVEGHPLGGGMLKVEPREAQRVVLMERPVRSKTDGRLIAEGIETLRRWRHHDGDAGRNQGRVSS